MLGFTPGLLPIIVLIGLAYVLVTLPEFFGVTAGMDVRWSAGHSLLIELKTLANDAKPWFARSDVLTLTRDTTMAALLAVPALWIAALIRSVTARAWRPFLVSVAAVLVGLVALPALTWAAELAVGLFRLARWIYHAVARFIEWISPVLAVAGLVIVGLIVLGALVLAVVGIHHARRWPTTAVVVVLLAVAGAAVHYGAFDGLFAWLRRVGATIAAWISAYVAPVIGWLVSAVIVASVVLVALGAVVALFGHVGRTVVLPFASAGGAGRDQAKCLDTAAGLGVALSMPMTAAVIDSTYRAEFVQDWQATPLIKALPSPVGLYDVLLRDPAVHLLAPTFRGFNPAVDLALGVLVGVIAIGSLLAGRGAWSTKERAGVLSPIMAAVGVAIALALPALLLTIWVKARSEN
jgi:hypothetical protein